jgi:hypothetical protein
MEQLEASMHVAHAHSSEPLNCLEGAAVGKSSQANGASAGAAGHDQPALRGQADADSKGACDAAARRRQERERDVSRGVPVLLLHVRGKLGLSVSFDLISGALCMHPGESDLPGQSFCTVRL